MCSLAQKFVGAAALFFKTAVVHEASKTSFDECIGIHGKEGFELIDSVCEARCHEFWVAMRATERLTDHFVDQTEFKQTIGRERQSLSGFGSLIGTLPENGSAAFGLITEYVEYCSMMSESHTAMARAPPEPPSPMIVEITGTRSLASS